MALAGVPAFADPVVVVPERDDPPRLAAHAPAPTGQFLIGAGFSADDGFLVQAAVIQPDLLHTGHKLALSAELSEIRQRALLGYDVPGVLPGFDLHTELFTQRRDLGQFVREGTGGAVSLARRLDPHTQIYGRYRLEAVATELTAADGKPSELPMLSEAELGNGTVATLGAGIVHDTLDERWLPRKGLRLELFTERADPRWGSTYAFERTGGSLDLARGLGPLTLRLHGHATYLRSDTGAPLSERLQHDGHAEVRGYALDSLPPLGSNVEAVGRVELELPVWKGLAVAGWVDAGLRDNTDPMYGPSQALLQRSVGGSLIWRTPIGPLRFDVAVPLDGKDRERQYLFGLGGWW